MALTNAERQRRYKQNLKDRAVATEGLATEIEQLKKRLALTEEKLALAEAHLAMALRMNSSTAILSNSEYKKLLKCLHPDILQGVAAKGSVSAEVATMYNEAFALVKSKEHALKNSR